MSYKLMIKTHNKTGLKYLCITKKDDYISYLGSGKRWKNHLKKYGTDVSTQLVYETENYQEFLVVCLETSIKLDVVLSDEFANLVNETGYNNYDGKPNVVLFWEYASDEIKSEIYKRRSRSLKNNHKHWKYSSECDIIKEKIIQKNKQNWLNKSNEEKETISQKHIENWNKKSLDERRNVIGLMQEGFVNFYLNKDTEKYKQWKNAISIGMKKYCQDNFDKISERNRNARLNTKDEVKQQRAEKIREIYKTGKHDAMFKKMSEDRRGSGNPNAKQIVVNGVLYGSVQEASRETGIAAHILYRKRKKHEKSKSN